MSETGPASSGFIAPSANAVGWFPGRAFDIAIGGGAKVATARAVAAGNDGAVYVLADLDGDTGASAIKGARDVALLKYDSAGKLAFTHILGAAQSASGFALAVSGEGKIAVAGAVEGALSNTDAAKGGADSFVALFDADGKELWTARRGAAANDEASAIAFAPDGGVIVAGRTESALGPALALGGADGYVRGFRRAGVELFTRQFGTSGNDAASALLVRDDGAGGAEIFTGGVENDRGVIRRFAYSTAAGFAAGATRDIGYFRGGAINALAAMAPRSMSAAPLASDRLDVGRGSARGGVLAGRALSRASMPTSSAAALDRASYLGSAQDDAVKSLALVGGDVYAAGTAGGMIAGQGAAGGKASFLARLDEDGARPGCAPSIQPAGFALSGLAVDASGASALDVLGLPRGAIAGIDTAPLAAQRAARGRRVSACRRRTQAHAIRIGAGQTFSTLAAAINRAMGGAGRAEIVREDGVERLRITARQGRAVRIEAGREGRDALGALGLKAGLVAANRSAPQRHQELRAGAGFARDLKLDKQSRDHAKQGGIVSRGLDRAASLRGPVLNPNAKELPPRKRSLKSAAEAVLRAEYLVRSWPITAPRWRGWAAEPLRRR